MKTVIDGMAVEITLNSSVVVKGVLLSEKDPIVKLEIKPTLPHYFIKVDMPLLKKEYKKKECTFNDEKTEQGGLIPTYFSNDYTLIFRRGYTIATVYKSTIREIK